MVVLFGYKAVPRCSVDLTGFRQAVNTLKSNDSRLGRRIKGAVDSQLPCILSKAQQCFAQQVLDDRHQRALVTR